MDGIAGVGDDSRKEGRNKVDGEEGKREGVGRRKKCRREKETIRTWRRGGEMKRAKMRKWRLNTEKRGRG